LDEPLPDEILGVWAKAVFVSGIEKLDQVFLGDDAEFAEFYHGRDFRRPDAVRPAPDFVNLPRFGGKRIAAFRWRGGTGWRNRFGRSRFCIGRRSFQFALGYGGKRLKPFS
jgi:hypothetical protein